MRPPIKNNSPNEYQTPTYAIDPLIPYIRKDWTIWECAEGKGNITKYLKENGFKVFGTDIITGTDFLNKELQLPYFDCIITNPPYQFKNQFLERCYELGKPFALLMPLTALETEKRQRLFRRYGIELVLMPKRINFEVPNGINNSSAWFASAWFTYKFNLGQQLVFSEK